MGDDALEGEREGKKGSREAGDGNQWCASLSLSLALSLCAQCGERVCSACVRANSENFVSCPTAPDLGHVPTALDLHLFVCCARSDARPFLICVLYMSTAFFYGLDAIRADQLDHSLHHWALRHVQVRVGDLGLQDRIQQLLQLVH